MDDQELTDAFHTRFYNNWNQTWEDTWYRGHKILKCPLDLWLYHEIIQEVKPDIIIECGTAHGGSAYYLADQLDLVGNGHVYTIDIEQPHFFPTRPAHSRLTYINDSSTAPWVVDDLRSKTSGNVTLVILDSAHNKEHVYQELLAYSPMVTTGSYLIVEDTNIHGHPVCPEHVAGPMEAIDAWVPNQTEFIIDDSKHKFYLTFNPRGYLKKIG